MFELHTLPTITEALPDYLTWLRGRKLSERSIETYRKDLARFAAWLAAEIGEPPSIGDITALAIERWMGAHAQLSATTMIKTLTALRSFTTWCIRRGYRADDPTSAIDRPRRRRPLPRALTAEQLAQLETALAAPLPVLDVKARRVRSAQRRAVLLGLYAGLRLAEQAALRWEDVDLGARTVTVRDGKGAKDRVIPLARRLYAELASVPAAERIGYVAGGKGGRQLSYKTLAHLYDRSESWLRAEWGLEISSHQLRHTFATRLYGSSGDIRAVQEALGHASLNDTQRYVAAGIDQTRAAIARLPESLAQPKTHGQRLYARQGRTAPEPAQCLQCGKFTPAQTRGRPRQFCDETCKSRYHRAQRASAT